MRQGCMPAPLLRSLLVPPLQPMQVQGLRRPRHSRSSFPRFQPLTLPLCLAWRLNSAPAFL